MRIYRAIPASFNYLVNALDRADLVIKSGEVVSEQKSVYQVVIDSHYVYDHTCKEWVRYGQDSRMLHVPKEALSVLPTAQNRYFKNLDTAIVNKLMSIRAALVEAGKVVGEGRSLKGVEGIDLLLEEYRIRTPEFFL